MFKKLRASFVSNVAYSVLNLVLLLRAISSLQRTRFSNSLIIDNNLNYPIESTTLDVVWIVVFSVLLLFFIGLMIFDIRKNGFAKNN